MARKKKSEVRKHTATIRVTEEVKDRATLAASMNQKSLADYCSERLLEISNADIKKLARKLAEEK